MSEAPETWDVLSKSEAQATLAEKRNGVKLPSVIVNLLTWYFCDVAKLTEVSEIPVDGSVELADAGNEAWEAKFKEEGSLPAMHERHLRTWAGQYVKDDKSVKDINTVGGVGTADRRMEASKDPELAGLTKLGQEKAMADMSAQGLPLLRIACMSLFIMMGKPQPIRSVMGENKLAYGEDPTMTQAGKYARKANKATLQKIISEKSYFKAAAFFSDLMKNYAVDFQVEESSLIA